MKILSVFWTLLSLSHCDCDDDDVSCDAWQVTVLEESAPRVPVEQLKGESSFIMFFSFFYKMDILN
jgi:hypothetical protein